jgi:hypothetical protein
MWLMSSVGFFSVVRKPGDDQLTIRARAREDLETLGRTYLPSLAEITAGGGTDYQFRARVRPEVLAEAVAEMVRGIDYANFKNEVAAHQGEDRAHAYGEVWQVLRQLAAGEDDE